jgi:hypothetical protein
MKLSDHEIKEKDYLTKYYAVLEGATIESISVVAESDYGSVNFWPTFKIKTKNGEDFVLEISQDPEGNGPGFVFGLPTPSVSR